MGGLTLAVEATMSAWSRDAIGTELSNTNGLFAPSGLAS